MIEQKALEIFSDTLYVPITTKAKSLQMQESKNTFPMPPWEHSTHMYTTVHSFIMVVLRVENRVNLKRYEISLEQIEQFN